MSKGKRVVGWLLAPLIAAAASVAAGVVAKNGPEFLEKTLLPWLREALEGAEGAAEKLPEKARSAASSGGDLAEQLTDRVRDATGFGSGTDESGGGLSADELTRRSDDRAKRRAKRRKATKKT